MSYNNNHAGMHLMWYRKYGSYDDLAHYDKLAERNAKQNKKEEILNSPSKEKVDDILEKNTITEEDLSTKSITPVNITPSHKKTKKNHTHKSHRKFPFAPKYGTEEVIDMKYFENMNLVSQNVMLMALKSKKDIGKIIFEAEELMKKDFRTNSELSIQNPWSWITALERSMVFLDILADMLDCSVQEFFICDDRANKTFIYKLLDSIDDDEWDHGFVDSETNNAEISIEGYNYSLISDFEGRSNLPLDFLIWDLTIEKEFIDGKAIYTISYGNLGCNMLSSYDYMLKGAYLYEEPAGKLKDTMERLIFAHPEWTHSEE